jgi:hypothetical protein
MSLWDWPALSGIGKPPKTIHLECERAVHGKPDASTRDFGYVALSEGFTSDQKGVEQAFLVEDQRQGGIVLWWRFKDRYYASHCYPSLLSDSSGRQGMETQILQWDPSAAPSISPALAALVLLPKVASLQEEWNRDWVKWSKSRNFLDPKYVIRLDPIEIDVNASELEGRVERAQDELIELPQEAVRDFYSGLLSRNGSRGEPPALLTEVKSPLGAEALAALLLPLSPKEAAQCSLAGWPTENPHWDGISCLKPPPNRQPGPPPSKEVLRKAILAGYAIQSNRPEAGSRPSPEVGKLLAFADSDKREIDSAELPQKQTSLTEAEIDLLVDAFRRVGKVPEPAYLSFASSAVRVAFRKHMLAKAEFIKAWWLLIEPPKALRQWLNALQLPEDVAGKGWLTEILRDWAQSDKKLEARCKELADQVEKALASTPSSTQ